MQCSARFNKEGDVDSAHSTAGKRLRRLKPPLADVTVRITAGINADRRPLAGLYLVVATGFDHFLATVKAVGSDMMAAVGLT